MKQMRLFFFLIFLFIVAAQSVSAENKPQWEKEPDVEYVLHIDDFKIPMAVDKLYQIPKTLTNPKIILKVSPYRVFNYCGISFNYPEYYEFNPDLENPKCFCWSMSGESTYIHYYCIRNYQDSETNKIIDEMMVINDNPPILNLKTGPVVGSLEKGRLLGNDYIREDYSFKSDNIRKIISITCILDKLGLKTQESIDLKSLIEESLIVN